MNPAAFLGGHQETRGRWSFTIGRELHGAFGGAFGGVVAAASLVAARSLAPDRRPSALDCRFLRGLGAGQVTAEAAVVHEGRTLMCVTVDVSDERGRRSTHSTVSLVEPAALLRHARQPTEAPAFVPYEEAAPWRNPPGVDAPIIETLGPRSVGQVDGGLATAIAVPWDEDGHDAAAACLAADLCVGPPVALALPDEWVPHPNPDLSLRFCGAVRTDAEVVGVGRLERLDDGLAAVSVAVWSGSQLAAVGVSSSLLLSTGGGQPGRQGTGRP